VIPPPVRDETDPTEINGDDLPDTRPLKKWPLARKFSKYPVARIVIILMRIAAIIAAICFPIEAILVALSGDLKPSEKKAAQEKAEREFQKRLQEQRVDPEQRKIETQKQAEARLDREFLEQERERKIWTILRLLTGNAFAVILVLLFAELLQVLLDISRNTQDLVEAQRLRMESHDVG
jgi:hypothetical protein